MPPPERRMLLILLGLAVAGQGVRYWATKPGQSPGGVQVLSTLSRGSPSAQRDSALQHDRPLAPGEQIDLDKAAAGDIARLPRVGPRLARTIVEDRGRHGPFGALEGLDRVPGIGPALLKALAPNVRFSGRGVLQESSMWVGGTDGTQPASLNLNSATIEDLDRLPGIGPAKARAIVRYRETHGPFSGPEGLAQVPGMSQASVNRLAGRIYAK